MSPLCYNLQLLIYLYKDRYLCAHTPSYVQFFTYHTHFKEQYQHIPTTDFGRAAYSKADVVKI